MTLTQRPPGHHRPRVTKHAEETPEVSETTDSSEAPEPGQYRTRGQFDRMVGLVTAMIATTAAVLLWCAVALNRPQASIEESHAAVIGVWRVLCNSEAPAVSAILTAIALALLAGVGLALVERRIATTARRSMNPGGLPLAPEGRHGRHARSVRR